MVGLIVLVACARPGTAQVVDGRTGNPVAGVEVRIADGETPCPHPVGPTDGDGRVSVRAGCVGGGWRLHPVDPTWWAPEPPVAAEAATLRAWRVPDGGVALLQGTELSLVPTNTAVDEVVTPAGERVRYPTELPPNLPVLGADRLLVLAEGTDGPLEPLLPGEARAFGLGEVLVQFGPWYYLGARVPAEGPPEPVEVRPAPVQTMEAGGRTIRWLSPASLPPGRYGILTESRARAVLFEVSG